MQPNMSSVRVPVQEEEVLPCEHYRSGVVGRGNGVVESGHEDCGDKAEWSRIPEGAIE